MNTKFYYPAVFQKESEGYSVWLYDIPGCVSQGNTFDEAVENISAAFGLFAEEFRANNEQLPIPTVPSDISLETKQFVAVIGFDWIEYQKKYNNKSIKKTLTIPAWLNTMAEEQHVNFSGLLQSALKEKLNL